MKPGMLGCALVLMMGLCAGQNLFAAQNCGNQDFNGAYGMLASGSITVPNTPITGPFARVGLVHGDGHGKVAINTTASYNGILFVEVITGSYAVSPDCSVVFHLDPFPPVNLPATLDALLSDNKRELSFMIVDPPGQTVHAVLRRQDTGGNEADEGGCSAKSLSKPYVLTMQGNVLTPAPGELPGEFVRVGKFTPDGSGNFSAETEANYSGFEFRPENFQGTYAVARDCTVSIQYTFLGVDYAWHGVLTDNSSGADLIVSNTITVAGPTNPGAYVISGTLQRQ